MNKIPLNIAGLDGGVIIKKGGGGGVTINNQEKSVDITENGTTEVTADAGFTGLSKVVVNTNVQSGGGALVSKPSNDVNFYDYDGTILHSYTKDEFLMLSAMPPLPEREGLICQEWNWGYEEAQEQVAEYGMCDIGATYITDDGKTRLYISIAEDAAPPIELRFTGSNLTASVDWGDGSPIESLSTSMSHSYQKKGDYCIKIEVTKGTLTLGTNSSSSGTSVLGSSTVSNFAPKVLKKAELGNSVYMGAYCFNMTSLESITLPNDIELNSTRFGKGALGRTQVKHVTIPKGVKGWQEFMTDYSYSSISFPSDFSLGQRILYACYNILRVVLPPNLTSISERGFYQNYGLVRVVIPKGVENIYADAFYYAQNMKIVDCSRCIQCPTLHSAKVFYGVPSDCKIIVPDALYDEWIAATNWSTYASYIIKKSDWDASRS
jgi:hypothetical protein